VQKSLVSSAPASNPSLQRVSGGHQGMMLLIHNQRKIHGVFKKKTNFYYKDFIAHFTAL
jgi:hypothetical protein